MFVSRLWGYGMRLYNDFIRGLYFYLSVIFYDICICSLAIFCGRSGVSTRGVRNAIKNGDFYLVFIVLFSRLQV